MTYHEQWRAISARIRGLAEAAELQARYLSSSSEDPYGTSRMLHDQARDILVALEAFRVQAGPHISGEANAAIERFLTNSGPTIRDSGSGGSAQHLSRAALIRLRAFEPEMSFLLTDLQETIRFRSERAFAHLQRSIVADADIARKWQAALRDHESACEKLGGTHLLSHGIWAFKAHAPGGRTDLVLQDVVSELSGIERFAEGIVLTEWKRAVRPADAAGKFAEAREQARDYSGGVLAGFELAGYRYAVVVTGEQVTPPEDQEVDGVVYRHVNIAVQPAVPSRAARR